MSTVKIPGTALVVLLFLFASAVFAADRIEVIQLHGRSANEIIPIIQPLLDPNTALSAQGYKLIIRGSESSIAQTHELIQQLDSPPKQLTISLRRGAALTNNRSRITASGTISSGDARISVNEGGPDEIRAHQTRRSSGGARISVNEGDDQADIRLHETRRSLDDDSIRRINVTEGRQAFIQTGQLVPVGERRVGPYGYRSDTIHYANVTSGFYVVPRISGEHVSLEVLQNNMSINRHGKQTFNVQGTGTTLRGRIGEWISIGGVTQQSSQSSSAILRSTKRNSSSDSQLYIKVDVVSN